jgi:meiotically up-regulated gene 157 (Mug157) protein
LVLRQMLEGIILRQAHCILINPLCNAFMMNRRSGAGWSGSDATELKTGVSERKWELDSLFCSANW